MFTQDISGNFHITVNLLSKNITFSDRWVLWIK